MLPVAANLRDARAERNWTQKQVADAIGVTNRDVSRWERGEVEPGRRYRHELARVLFDGQVGRMYDELENKTPRTVAAAGGMDKRS